LAHPNPKRVLIIGGGDGGTLREVLRHPEVEICVMVDIDGEVIRCGRQYFPQVAIALDDPRAEVIVGDGLAYVEEHAAAGDHFDVILVDSTDPVDAAVELFTEKFYRHCATLLGDQGILVPQSDSPTFYLDRVAHVYQTLSTIFQHTALYMGQVTAYPGGLWAYTAASQGIDVGAAQNPTSARVQALEAGMRYANGAFIQAAFALPTYVKRNPLPWARPVRRGRHWSTRCGSTGPSSGCCRAKSTFLTCWSAAATKPSRPVRRWWRPARRASA
jgi:spermidine synthase